MDKETFRELQADLFRRIEALTETKGEEYSRSDDQLANFKRSAKEAGTTPFVVWLIFFNKHIDAIKYRLAGGKSSESVSSRIDDAILYLILLEALLIDE